MFETAFFRNSDDAPQVERPKNEAWRIAANIAKLPDLLRK